MNTTPRWRKSSRSDEQGGLCVEVADLAPAIIGVRDSENPHGPHLALGPTVFADLLTRIKSGGLDL